MTFDILLPDAQYTVIAFLPDGRVQLRNVTTGHIFTANLTVDLNHGTLRVDRG